MSVRFLTSVAFLLVWTLCKVAPAELLLASPFSDNAILQQGDRVPVWGTANPGDKVSVAFGAQIASTVADANGKWRVVLEQLGASAEPRSLVVKTMSETVVCNGVLVGEVWLASGQSNMQFSMKACAKSLDQVRSAMEDPTKLGIHMLRIGSDAAEGPAQRFDSGVFHWVTDSPAARSAQSAVAFFFARRLHQQLGVPIGIIDTSWGGKPIEGFIPRQQFARSPTLQRILDLAEANRLEELKKMEGGVFVRNSAGHPGRIFNSRIAPLAPYGVRGAIWYQGESNAGIDEDPRGYRHKMRALTEGWRGAFENSEMPFYFVQLPSYRNELAGWVRLREEQRLSLKIPRSGMAVTIDLKSDSIHPANKIDVAERLARWPLAEVYGDKALVSSGPLFLSVDFDSDKARVHFRYVGAGLMVAKKEGLEAPVETKDADLQHFELCGSDGVWYPAKARIDGPTVIVTSGNVLRPTAVRYACEGAPSHANLYNRAGLPASPFGSELNAVPWVNSRRPEPNKR